MSCLSLSLHKYYFDYLINGFNSSEPSELTTLAPISLLLQELLKSSQVAWSREISVDNLISPSDIYGHPPSFTR